MSAMQNLIIGTQQLAEQREKSLADVQREMKQEQAQTQAGATGEAEQEAGATTIEAMTPEEMAGAIHKLSEIVLQLSQKLDNKGESL